MHEWDDWTDCCDPCFRKRRVVKKDIVIQCIDGICFPVVTREFRKRVLVKFPRRKVVRRFPVVKKRLCDESHSDWDV
jgi:hypothetical protein